MAKRLPADPVGTAVEQFLQQHRQGRLWVGYSGGRDSTVLLHALARLPVARERGLSAVHIDHGLHPDSAQWAQQASRNADALEVPIQIHRVELSGRSEVGEEARARAARREVYARCLAPQDWILLAHHRDDQAETLLLRLIGGSGLPGLGAMRQVADLGCGHIGRPLLGVAGAAIADYARAHAIDHVNDPANSDPRHERSWLRAQVLPQLAVRHGQVTARLARTADWLGSVADWLAGQAMAERARRQGLDPAALNIADWADCPEPLRFEVLAGWLEALGQERPGVIAFGHIESDLIAARPDASPSLRWGAGSLRRYRQNLAWVPDRVALDPHWESVWQIEKALALPDGFGLLNAERIGDGPALAQLKVTPRRGGERFRAAPNRPNRPLQHWLQELGVPPWERERLLLLSDTDGQLLAVLAADSGAVVLRNGGVAGWVFGKG